MSTNKIYRVNLHESGTFREQLHDFPMILLDISDVLFVFFSYLFWIFKQEVAAAFVFFKTRYAADVAAEVLLSNNPMSWVTNYAPEPHDVYWSNLCIPCGQIWLRRIATLLAAVVFMFLFLIPVTFVQGLTQLDQLQYLFPFLRGLLKK